MRSLEGEITDRVESQLLGALELLQTYQDGRKERGFMDKNSKET
jgi:hypothetical protein